MGERFQAMELWEAKVHCFHRQDIVFENCGRCDHRVGLHCINCKIQVTGCLCTEIDRFGENDAMKRIIDRIGFEEAKERLAKMGIVIPKGFGENN